MMNDIYLNKLNNVAYLRHAVGDGKYFSTELTSLRDAGLVFSIVSTELTPLRDAGLVFSIVSTELTSLWDAGLVFFIVSTELTSLRDGVVSFFATEFKSLRDAWIIIEKCNEQNTHRAVWAA